jgi:hypothetical protein
VALHRRTTAELIAEELRRLDPDEAYESAVRFGVRNLKSSAPQPPEQPVVGDGAGGASGEDSGEASGDGRRKAAAKKPAARKGGAK